jgi:pimeloyl-ACP methyl ester carboxylesterase
MNAVVAPEHLRASEPSRARYPDETGYAEREGVRLFWERYGEGDPTVLFINPGPIVQSRMWKAQVPYLARHGRVVTFDGRGCGRSDRPTGGAAYRTEELAKDALAVLNATDSERAVTVTISGGSRWALWLLANHPDRFAGAAFIGPYLSLTPWQPVETMRRTYMEPSRTRRAARMLFDTLRALPRNARSPTYRRFARHVSFREGVDMYNGHTWLNDRRAYVEWLARKLNFAEPHSTRQIEDGIEWAMDADSRTLVDWWVATDIDPDAILTDRDEILAHCSRVRCPVLVIHGEHDLAVPPDWGRALADATGGRFLPIPDCGHQPQGRKPVPVNLALREFVASLP